MLDKPFSVLIGVGMFLFVGSILMESSPQSRLNMACAPVRWTGNIMGSMAALTDSEKVIDRIAVGTDEFDYGCQFTLWRLIYGKTYTASQNVEKVGTKEKQGGENLPAGGMAVGKHTQSGAGEHVQLLAK
jgi:hypothetical protein